MVLQEFWKRRWFATGLLLFLLLSGCGSGPDMRVLKGGGTDVTYNPRPGTSAFQRLHLEKMKSVVVLRIGGDDVQGNMVKVARVMLDKGYEIRDPNHTLQELKRANLLDENSVSVDAIQKASEIFKEQMGIAGRVELMATEPTRVLVALYLVDLRAKKIIWTVKASYTGYYIGSSNPYERGVTDSINKSLSVIPRAKP